MADMEANAYLQKMADENAALQARVEKAEAIMKRCLKYEGRVAELTAALEQIADEYTWCGVVGPRNDDTTMWKIARAALQTKEQNDAG